MLDNEPLVNVPCSAQGPPILVPVLYSVQSLGHIGPIFIFCSPVPMPQIPISGQHVIMGSASRSLMLVHVPVSSHHVIMGPASTREDMSEFFEVGEEG